MSGILRTLGRVGESVLKAGAFAALAIPHAPWYLAPAIYFVGHVLGVNLPTP